MIFENHLPTHNYHWIDVQEPQEKDVERLNSEFNLPYLLVLDCLRPEHLPKYEESEGRHFLMMRSFDPDSSYEDTTVQELTRKIALFINNERMISIHRVELEYLTSLVEKFNKTGDAPKSVQSLVHQVVLAVIRTYESPIDRLQDSYDDFEQEVLERRVEGLSTKRIYCFRRQLFVLKRILKQTNDSLSRFREFWNDHPSMLQDLRENIDQLYFRLDEISNNFEHLFQLHISLNDQRANDVMKILTGFSTVLLPLNFLASFYGMNFVHLPGLESPHAFGIVVGVMLLFTISGFWFFKKKGWFNTARE